MCAVGWLVGWSGPGTYGQRRYTGSCAKQVAALLLVVLVLGFVTMAMLGAMLAQMQAHGVQLQLQGERLDQCFQPVFGSTSN